MTDRSLLAPLVELVEIWRRSAGEVRKLRESTKLNTRDQAAALEQENCDLRHADQLAAALSRLGGPQEPIKFDWNNLREVLCDVSQIFNGWRPDECWSKWDEQVSQAVVAIQRAIELPPVTPKV